VLARTVIALPANVKLKRYRQAFRKVVDAKEVGRELGVRYVLEGSVQRDQNRVRINAQLIHAESGAHIWAERFEENVADLFKLQDQVVARLANTLGFELVKAEADKSARSNDPDAIDLTMRGLALLQQATPRADQGAARQLKGCAGIVRPEPCGVRQARIEGGRYGVGIFDVQGNQGATRHLQADPAGGRRSRALDRSRAGS
jgi:hypothetical protein